MINLPFDCNNHIEKLPFSPSQSPKLLQSFSEVKPPTLNSSIIFNGSHQNNKQMNFWKQEHICDEKIVGGMKKKKFNSPTKFQEHFQQQKEPTQILIRKFMKNLMQQAYIYKESFFNSFSRSILTEKYLEIEGKQNESKFQFIIQWCYLFWQSIVFLLIFVLLLLFPYQVGFQIENNMISSNILNLLLASEILIYLLKLLQFKDSEIMIMLTVSIIQFISYTIIQFNTSNTILVFLSLITQFLSGLVTLQIKYEKWKIQLQYDLDFYFLMCKLILTIHFCACVWHFIGISENQSWITALGLEEHDNFKRYCISFYWSAAQILNTGQGQIQIISNMEFIYSSGLIIISWWIFCYILSSSQVYCRENETKQMLLIMNKFLNSKNITPAARDEVRNYIQSSNSDRKNIQNVLSSLPTGLKQNILEQIQTEVIQSCKCLKMFSASTKSMLTQLIQIQNYSPNEDIKSEDIFLSIIDTGQIQMKEYGKPIKKLQSGDYFGEFSFFSGIRGKTVYTTIQQTTLYKISSDSFKQLIQSNKLDHERFMFIKDSLLNGNYKILDLYCYSCESAAHLISDCHLLTYKPNIQRLIKQAISGEQDRLKFTRNQTVFHKPLMGLIANQDALKLFRIKYEIEAMDTSSSQENEPDDYSSVSQEQSSDQHFSYIRSNENIKEIEIIKSQDQFLVKNQQYFEIDNQDIYRIRSPNYQKQEQSSHRFFQPKDARILHIQGDQTSQQSLVNDGTNRLSNFTSIYERPKNDTQQKSISPNNVERIKKNQLKRKDDDPDSQLSLTNRFSEDQLSVPLNRHTKNSIHSIPSRKMQSCKKFSSKLSSIKQQNTDSITNFKTTFSSYKLQFPTYRGVIDLSIYDPSFEEFEIMYNYSIYFPHWNISTVIQRMNNQLESREDMQYSKRSSISSAQRMIFLLREQTK